MGADLIVTAPAGAGPSLQGFHTSRAAIGPAGTEIDGPVTATTIEGPAATGTVSGATCPRAHPQLQGCQDPQRPAGNAAAGAIATAIESAIQIANASEAAAATGSRTGESRCRGHPRRRRCVARQDPLRPAPPPASPSHGAARATRGHQPLAQALPLCRGGARRSGTS